MTDTASDTLRDNAYAAFDEGQLHEAHKQFAEALTAEPEDASLHYMRGLAAKYLRDWPRCLQDNLRAIELSEEFNEAAHWNAAIAATALEDWTQARQLWAACELPIPEGEGEIITDLGVCIVRLNPWADGETVWVRRIDPVRGRILNVPLAESGYHFGDIVLHDGAPTGYRENGAHHAPVFNALQRVTPSLFQTFVAFISAPSEDDLTALLGTRMPGIGYLEDWTDSIQFYCLRCSYGTPHAHGAESTSDSEEEASWQPERNLGIAAQSRHTVEKLLRNWLSGNPHRQADAVDARRHDIPALEDGHVWWRDPDEDEENESEGTTTPD